MDPGVNASFRAFLLEGLHRQLRFRYEATVKDYACRAMTQLAKRYERSFSGIDQVAEAEEIPAKYLAGLSDLRQRAGRESPGQTRWLPVVQRAEGHLPIGYRFGGGRRLVGRELVGGDLGAEAAWKSFGKFERGAESVSLADLAVREPKAMYYI